MPLAIAIRGLGCLSCLGDTVDGHLDAIGRNHSGLVPLGEMEGAPEGFETLPAGWIRPRAKLAHRSWSPAAMATLHAARTAVDDAGWDDLSDVPVFAAGSRGSMAGWIEPWPGRRPVRLMAASNSLAAEPASALCAEFNIHAPWHFASSGCCAGLDALLHAALWLRAGRSRRALVAAVDLPLVGPVLEAYARTGIVSTSSQAGMLPAEGAAAICLEACERPPAVELADDASASEPNARFGGNRELTQLAACLTDFHHRHGSPTLCIPHASGTAIHLQHEQHALHTAFPELPESLGIKPLTGHCVGASALLEAVIACALLRRGGPSLPPGSSVLKIASALGGKHSLALFRSNP